MGKASKIKLHIWFAGFPWWATRQTLLLSTLGGEIGTLLCICFCRHRINEQPALPSTLLGLLVAFREVLSQMHLIYGHELTMVVRLTAVDPAAASNTPYEKRGWTTFESMVAFGKPADSAAAVMTVGQDPCQKWNQMKSNKRPPRH